MMLRGVGPASVAVAILAALWLGGVGLVRGTWAVGGSDSSCYALMADAFAGGRLQPSSTWLREAPWPDAQTTAAPAGFVPSPVRANAASPICAPGFAVLLAPFRAVGGPDAIFAVTPVAGVALVWLTFRFARALAGPLAGALAAVLVATSPIVLFQVVQPMNDVTTAALWMAVLVAALGSRPQRVALTGALAGLALLVRPNLAPAAAAVGLWIVTRAWAEAGTSASALRTPAVRTPTVRRARALALANDATLFAAGLAPFLVAIASLNHALYGSAWSSGYGNPRELFSLAVLPTNVATYGRALVETQTPLPLLALFAPFVGRRAHRDVCWLALAVAGTIAALYLLYRPFPEWWYIRFLLPALAPALALASTTVALLLERLRGPRASLACLAVALVLAVFGVWTASIRQAFALRDLEARFRHSAEVVRDRLPPNTVALTVWESGSVRYHAGREAILWDSLDSMWLDRSVEWLQAREHSPVILIERWEEPLFRARFGEHAAVGGLDWPPRFEIDRQVRIFDPADRARYLAGEPVTTEHVRGRRR